MLVIPELAAFFRHAAPESESRLTIMRTLTPSLIIESQIVPNLAVSPPAFWMSDWMPASVKALVRLGRSLPSQRGDVVASGRITPTLPLAAAVVFPPEGLLLLLSLLLPQAAAAKRTIAPTAARLAILVRLDVTICPNLQRSCLRDGCHAVCCCPQHTGLSWRCIPHLRGVCC